MEMVITNLNTSARLPIQRIKGSGFRVYGSGFRVEGQSNPPYCARPQNTHNEGRTIRALGGGGLWKLLVHVMPPPYTRCRSPGRGSRRFLL